MSEKNNSIDLLTKIVTKQQLIITTLTKLVSDLSKVTLSTVQKCQVEGCSLPHTMSHVNKHMCDKHVTIDIVTKNSSESDWSEVENAEQVRYISDYLKIIDDLEKGPPVHLLRIKHEKNKTRTKTRRRKQDHHGL
jgi:hypothetical protein